MFPYQRLGLIAIRLPGIIVVTLEIPVFLQDGPIDSIEVVQGREMFGRHKIRVLIAEDKFNVLGASMAHVHLNWRMEPEREAPASRGILSAPAAWLG